MASKKRLAATLGAMALTAVLAVGGTLAYLSTITNTEENKFSSAGNITGELTETDWEYGKDGWTDYLPGDSTGKNPVIDLTDTKVYAAVGMKVVCKDADGKVITFEDFQKKYASVSTDGTAGTSTKWTKMDNMADGSDFYYYNTTVKGGATDPLFTDVTILQGIKTVYYNTTANKTITVYKTDENGNKVGDPISVETGETIIVESGEKVYIDNGDGTSTEVTGDVKLPSFQIDVTGYAVQADNQDKASAPTEADLTKLADLATK